MLLRASEEMTIINTSNGAMALSESTNNLPKSASHLAPGKRSPIIAPKVRPMMMDWTRLNRKKKGLLLIFFVIVAGGVMQWKN